MNSSSRFCFLCCRSLDGEFETYEDECPVIVSLCQIFGLPVTDRIKLTQIANSDFCANCQGNIQVAMVTFDLIKSLELRLQSIRADFQSLIMLTKTTGSVDGSLPSESSGAAAEVKKYFLQCLSRCEVKIPQLSQNEVEKYQARGIKRRRIRKNLAGVHVAQRETDQVNHSQNECDKAGPEVIESQHESLDAGLGPMDVLAVELSSESFEQPEEPRRKRGRPRKNPKGPKKPKITRTVNPSSIEPEAQDLATTEESYENNEKSAAMPTKVQGCTETEDVTRTAQQSTEKKKRGTKAIAVCVYCGLDFEATCRRPRDPEQDATGETENSNYEKFPYMCITEGCTRIFPSIKKLRVHHQHKCLQNPKTTARPLCSTCGKSFATATLLRYHIEGVHENKFRFYCEQCGAGFQVNSDLKRHIDFSHVGQRNFACDICGAAFKKKHHLISHRQTHTKDHPCVCEICGKGFPCNSKLKRHVEYAHSEGENYECETCSRRFKSKVHLDHHKWYYHSEKKLGTRPRPTKIVPAESATGGFEGLQVGSLSGQRPNVQNSEGGVANTASQMVPLAPEFYGNEAASPMFRVSPMFPRKFMIPGEFQPQLH